MKTDLKSEMLTIYKGASLFMLVPSVFASTIPLANSPLFLSNPQKANVLVILDNSNSMDENARGEAVGSNNPLSKSEIARAAVKSLITTYTGKINMGLMAYQQTGVIHQNLDNSPYDVSYDPANYDPGFTGNRDSTTKKFRIEEPDNPGFYVYYNVALPFYYGGAAGNTSYCYSTTAHAFNNGETPPTYDADGHLTALGGPWDDYRCFNHKNGANATSDALNDGAGYVDYLYHGGFYPTDSDLAQGITDFGSRMASFYVGDTWFSNKSPGRGYLHIPVADLDATQAAKLNTKLATSQFTNNRPTNPAFPLQNAGLTPIEGTLLTAKDYFEGNLNNASEGGPQPAPQESCGKNFIALLTDGLPSTDKDGNTITNPTTALAAAASAANVLHNAQIGSTNSGIDTYIIGFALPYGVDPTTLNQIAVAGGTGSAYLANNLTTLQTAFNSIFTDILGQPGASSSAATNSTSLSVNSHIYQARFNSEDWSGQLLSKPISTTGAISATVSWDAGVVLNSQTPSSREIITYSRDSRDGIPFQWSNISSQTDTTQKDYLNLAINGFTDKGAELVDFLRGTAVSGFRVRTTKLGDIVDSTPFYVNSPDAGYNESQMPGYDAFKTTYQSRAEMIYAGANDGMLHGFDASNGEEKIAYVPGAVYAHLSELADPDYGTAGGPAHRYFVDGSPMVADANLNDDTTPAWKTVLVAGLNGGGQAYYGLDITDPSTFSETNAAGTVLWEFTDEDDADLGYTFNQPVLNRQTNQSGQIVRMQNGRWAAIVGNGYNNTVADGHASTSGHAYLYVIFLEGPTGTGNIWQSGTDYIKIDTKAGSASTPNGLSTPRPVDTDNDGRVDTVYAGDLLGNLWKFDLSSSTNIETDWKVAYGTTASPQPLFTATDSSGTPQPITSAPVIHSSPNGGYMVGFGTGKYLGISDLLVTDVQTLYGIWDHGSSVSGRSDLVEQKVLAETSVSGATARITTHNPVDYNVKKGWYMDLPDSGERVAYNPILPSAGRFAFTTLTPDLQVCNNGGSSWLMVLDYLTGGRLPVSPFANYGTKVSYTDANGDTQEDFIAGLKIEDIMSTPTVINDWSNQKQYLVGSTSGGNLKNFALNLPGGQRNSWREIFRN